MRTFRLQILLFFRCSGQLRLPTLDFFSLLQWVCFARTPGVYPDARQLRSMPVYKVETSRETVRWFHTVPLSRSAGFGIRRLSEPDVHMSKLVFATNRQICDEEKLLPALFSISLQPIVRAPGLFHRNHSDR